MTPNQTCLHLVSSQVSNHVARNPVGSAVLDLPGTAGCRLAASVVGPSTMAASDLFGQWFTVELRNLGEGDAHVNLAVLFPDGFEVRLLRMDSSSPDGFGFTCLASPPQRTPARVDCLRGTLPAGCSLFVHILAMTFQAQPGPATITASAWEAGAGPSDSEPAARCTLAVRVRARGR